MNTRLFTRSVIVFLCVALVSSNALAAGRMPLRAKNGIVASASQIASDVGVDILRQGGNAVDAAVATAFALAVTWPSAGNIGGGGFMVYHGEDGHATAFDFREKAPLAATQDMYIGSDGRSNNLNHQSLLSVGVPGTVAGLYLAHQKLGHLPWAQLVDPAVRLARDGIPISYALQSDFARAEDTWNRYPSSAKVFLKADASLYEMGDTWVQADLAKTLERIRDNGKDGFYTGETAALLAQFMHDNGGLITEEDLALYEAVEREPIRGSYRGYEVISMPPPSSGGVAIVESLNILEGFDLAQMGHNSAEYLHILTEVMRRAFADRAEHLGDPDFNPDMPISKLLDKDYADKLRASIDMDKASVSDETAFSQAYESEQTTHFSVADSAGNMVSLTYTLERSYGSRIVAEGAGFLLNNEMGDFNPVPGVTNRYGQIGTPANIVAPQKRMLSSMSPTIIAKEGKPLMAIGSPGGRTIINTTLQIILNSIDHDMNIAEAIEAPRMHHQWLPDVTRFESWGFSADTLSLYEQMGHELTSRGSQGAAMGVFSDTAEGLYLGAADSRSPDGGVSGY
ncbi:MAG: gamma-glutamyltransferase [Pseudohongiellaceae bacterium]|nr:gamma-glutamyltransferase [Pseudohongiellaceae bacterium]